MIPLTRAADVFYTFRFLKLLVTPWEDTDAYRLGIVDKNGNTLKYASDLRTGEERSAYTTFHRLVYNIKRLLNKIPGGKTRLASYAAALYLIKEETSVDGRYLCEQFASVVPEMDPSTDISENSSWILNRSGNLLPGTYTLVQDAPMRTGEFRAYANTQVVVHEETEPVGQIAGILIFEVTHKKTSQKVYVSAENITR